MWFIAFLNAAATNKIHSFWLKSAPVLPHYALQPYVKMKSMWIINDEKIPLQRYHFTHTPSTPVSTFPVFVPRHSAIPENDRTAQSTTSPWTNDTQNAPSSLTTPNKTNKKEWIQLKIKLKQNTNSHTYRDGNQLFCFFLKENCFCSIEI